MERRTVIGALGTATVGGAGWLHRRRGGSRDDERIRIETLDAPGSSAGEWTFPTTEPLVVTFFATWCQVCSRQMDSIGAAEAAVGADLPFLSVTSELVGRSVSREEVVEWWTDHDGDWAVGVDDAGALAERFGVTSIPKVVVLDESGTVSWSATGDIDSETLRTAARGAVE